MKTLFNRCMDVIDSNYAPADRMFTSEDEIKYVSELMGLEELSYWDMRNLRDMWVALNRNKDYHTDDKASLRFRSVVAIIDHQMFNKSI